MHSYYIMENQWDKLRDSMCWSGMTLNSVSYFSEYHDLKQVEEKGLN